MGLSGPTGDFLEHDVKSDKNTVARAITHIVIKHVLEVYLMSKPLTAKIPPAPIRRLLN